jgi:hypothetical protein
MSSASLAFRTGLRTASLAASLLLLASGAAGLFSEDFEQAFFDEGPNFYTKDHSLIIAPDGVFHIFYMPGRAGEGWVQQGNEVDFGHATSTDLVHWTIHPRVLSIDPANEWKSRNVWAPHVILRTSAGDFLMAYTGVDSLVNQAIGIAVSPDLFAWTDMSVTAPAYYPDTSWANWSADGDFSNCRDPYLRELDGEMIMVTTARTRPGYRGLPSLGALSLARSPDGLSWLDDGAPLVINNSSSAMEYSHLVENPATSGWNLFYTRTVFPGGVHYLWSESLTSGWSLDGDEILDSLAIASDIVEGNWIYSATIDYQNQEDLLTRGIRFDNLSWDSDGSPQIQRVNSFLNNWQLVEGDITLTLHDRPNHRSGQASNMEGRFWVNTAEAFSGPYGGGCATCAANESLTGRLRSNPFVIEGGTIELWIGGTASELTYVALAKASSGAILRATTGPDSDVMVRHEWDVTALAGVEVFIDIVDDHPGGHVSVDAIRELPATTAAAEAGTAPVRMRIALAGANPVPGLAEFTCDLEGPGLVNCMVYDPTGRLVRIIHSGALPAGRSRLRWDGRGVDGRAVAPGVYFVRLNSPGRDGVEVGPAVKLVIPR